MNRTKIVSAILEEYRKHDVGNKEKAFLEALKYVVSDASLLSYAWEMGIDTDSVLAMEVK